mgnify:CR=1 FL=1
MVIEATKTVDLFEWADCSDLIGRTDENSFSNEKRQRVRKKYSSVRTHQLSMRFSYRLVNLVTQDRHHLLDKLVANLFTQGCPRFSLVNQKLRADGILQLGDLLQMSEEDFRSYTSSEKIVSHVKARLEELGFKFQSAVSNWQPSLSDW